MSYKCEIIADSKNTFGDRITTFLITFPRFILAEFNTHRMFSRNSASSRAIPFRKTRTSVMEHPFIPINWMKDHKGMQGSEYINNRVKKWMLRQLWLTGRNFSVLIASMLHFFGLTKQICNRLLEPWMYHTCLVTATEWENFFYLRANSMAEIHIQKIAFMMLESYNESVPVQLNQGEWHIPFLKKIDMKLLVEYLREKAKGKSNFCQDAFLYADITHALRAISTAMCARTSYISVGDAELKSNFEKDIALHDRLRESGHMSPFEHIAMPMDNIQYAQFIRVNPILGDYNTIETDKTSKESMGWCGNFKGFISYRKLIPNENRSDSRVVKIKTIVM